MKTLRNFTAFSLFGVISMLFVTPADAASRGRTDPPPPIATGIKPAVSGL